MSPDGSRSGTSRGHPLDRAGLPGRATTAVVIALGLAGHSLLRLFFGRRGPGRAEAGSGRPVHLSPRLEETLGALVDAVLPANPDDPDRSPGAREAGAVGLLLRPPVPVAALGRFPIGAYLHLVAAVADAAALLTAGRRFHRLESRRRSRLFGRLLRVLPLLFVPVAAASEFAFVGGLVSGRGLDYLGMPGEVERFEPGPGTPEEPRSATEDGNLP